MLITKTNANGVESLERAAQWERAAQLLDLDMNLVRRLRTPHIECVSRHECSAGVALVQVAATAPVCGDAIASVHVSDGGAENHPADRVQEMQVLSALAGYDAAAAAITLQLPSGDVNESDLWLLARDCAPVLVRLLGNVRLLPDDLQSTAFALWTAHAAAQFQGGLRIPAMPPVSYVSLAQTHFTHSLLACATRALAVAGKKLRGSSVGVIGTGAIPRRMMQMLVDSGCKIVCLADESGALVDAGGMEIAPLLRHIESGGLLVEYSEAEHALHSDAITSACDLLLLDGYGTELTGGNAAGVRAAVVIEGRPDATNREGLEILDERGILAVPHRLPASVALRIALESCFAALPGEPEFVAAHLTALWEKIDKLQRSLRIPFHVASFVLALQCLVEREHATCP